MYCIYWSLYWCWHRDQHWHWHLLHSYHTRLFCLMSCLVLAFLYSPRPFQRVFLPYSFLLFSLIFSIAISYVIFSSLLRSSFCFFSFFYFTLLFFTFLFFSSLLFSFLLQILGNNECIEPYTSNMYVRRVRAGEFIVVNPHLLKDLVERGLWTKEVSWGYSPSLLQNKL